jgi:hypothetical protein
MGTANSNIPNLSNTQATTADQAYRGIFKLEKRILSFSGCSVPLDNITQVSNYPVRPVNKISLLVLIFSIFISLASLSAAITAGRYEESLKEISLVVFFLFAVIAAIGIGERLRAYNYGITVELSSGFRHYFIHKSKDFIDQTYRGFIAAIQENRDFQAVFNNANVISVGNGSVVGNITGNAQVNSSGSAELSSGSAANVINFGQGNVTGDVTGNTQSNHANGQASASNVANSIDFGSGNVTGNVNGNNQQN